MSAHTECGRAGKFDCDFDEWVYNLILWFGDPGEGDVQSPSAWFCEVDLDPDAEEHADKPQLDAAAIEHYGSRWLIARELDDGRWFVEVYDTVEARQARLDVLRAAYEEWDLSALTEYPNP